MTLLLNHDLVQDSLQELFLKLYQRRATLTQPDDLKPYLMISFRNTLYTQQKKTHLNENEAMEETVGFLTDTVEDIYIDTEELQIKQSQIVRLLDELSIRQREIVYYRYIQELSFDEICERMDLNYQSAQNLLQRSLKKMKLCYKK
jgi:RNA polymerase sigma factor (sigma-70 family)